MADEATPAPAENPADVVNDGTEQVVDNNDTPAPQSGDQPEAVKGDGASPEAEGDTPGEGEDAAGAPEAYADFTAPEGVALDAGALDEFRATAKEDNLSQEKAQKYVDIAAKLVANQQQAFVDEVIATRESWIEASRNDAEFGGDNLDANLAIARRGLEAYASPEGLKLFDETGLGNHPEIIRIFIGVGQSIAEDKIVPGGTAASPPAALADRLYPPKTN